MAKFRILCIDGGGIRGIIPTVWLSALQEEVGAPLYQYFDLICGSSTGAILGAGIALEKDPEDIQHMYKTVGPKIFKKKSLSPTNFMEAILRPRYDDNSLEDALQEAFGIDTELGEAKRPLCITSYDLENRQSFIMRSYDNTTKNIKMWEACKASSSAPSYFPAHILQSGRGKRPLIDGGIVANNPSGFGLAEAIRIRRKDSLESVDRDIMLISLGTGSATRPISAEKAVTMGPLDWALPIIDCLFDGSSDASSYVVPQILAEDCYVRMQIELKSASDDLDDASPTNINKLINAAHGYLTDEDGEDKFKKIIRMIK